MNVPFSGSGCCCKSQFLWPLRVSCICVFEVCLASILWPNFQRWFKVLTFLYDVPFYISLLLILVAFILDFYQNMSKVFRCGKTTDDSFSMSSRSILLKVRLCASISVKARSDIVKFVRCQQQRLKWLHQPLQRFDNFNVANENINFWRGGTNLITCCMCGSCWEEILRKSKWRLQMHRPCHLCSLWWEIDCFPYMHKFHSEFFPDQRTSREK